MLYPQMRYLRFAAVQEMVGNRSRSSIYRDVKAGRLPKPIYFGGRPYWIESEVIEALEQAAK